MSHYSVLVLTDDEVTVDELLAPYNESIRVAPYIYMTKDELIAREKQEIKNYKNGPYAEFLKDKDAYKAKYSSNPDHLNYIENEFPKRLYWTNARIYKEAIRYYEPEEITEDGSVISTYNPKSKWDWYVEGGRFSGLLKLKDSDEHTDCAYASEIDFSPNEEEYNDAIRFWEIVVEGDKPINDHEKHMYSIFNKEYYLKRYKTKEEYAKKTIAFSTWAVLTPDGVWHEPGKMGWFGMHSATPEEEVDFFNNYNRFIESAIENNWLVTVVDCHI